MPSEMIRHLRNHVSKNILGGLDVVIWQALGFRSGIGESFLLFITVLGQIQNFLRRPSKFLYAVSLKARKGKEMRWSFLDRLCIILRFPIQTTTAPDQLSASLSIFLFCDPLLALTEHGST